MKMFTKNELKNVLTWYLFTQEAGLPIGGPEMNRFVKIEIHYNNPELRDGE